jgi:D-tyrosyl-tRNA(Tyr) deacylase
MIAVVQRVSEAQLYINQALFSKITQGFVVFLGIHETDTIEDVQYLSSKISGLRIFSDEDGKMNLDLSQVKGDLLLVSQFTLIASTKKGNRPSFIEASRPEKAIPLYEEMIKQLQVKLSKTIQTGVFGADMKISLVNDGPVTIIIDSKNPN